MQFHRLSGRKYQYTFKSHVLPTDNASLDSAIGHVLNVKLKPSLYKAVTSFGLLRLYLTVHGRNETLFQI
jgi:hypothetical protein